MINKIMALRFLKHFWNFTEILVLTLKFVGIQRSKIWEGEYHIVLYHIWCVDTASNKLLKYS